MTQRKPDHRKPRAAKLPRGPIKVKYDSFASNVQEQLIEEFRDLLEEEAALLAGDKPVNANHLQQAFECLIAKPPYPEWGVMNRRRIYLIQKEYDGTILPDERKELEVLQTAANRHLRRAAPRPLETLWDVEAELKRRADEKR